MLCPERLGRGSRARLHVGLLGGALLALCVAAAPARAATLVVRNNPGAGEFATITAAMAVASSGDVIQVNAGTYSEHPVWNKAVDISCVGGDVTIQADTTASGFVIQISGTNPVGKSLHSDGHRIIILPATGATNQAGIQCTAAQNTAISDCDFSGFVTATSGAAIQATTGLITSCTFTNCFAGIAGGAISGQGDGKATLCTFVNCRAPDGGAIINIDDVTHCDFDTCIAVTGFGGALRVNGNVEDCTFLDCVAGLGSGGAIGSAIDILRCDFSFCSAEFDGGAISAGGAVGDVLQCTFTNCTAGASGGAIHAKAIVGDCSFDSCQSGGAGGAVSAVPLVTLCSFIHCGAGTNGGGVADTDTVEFSTFTDCNAPDGQGGAIFDLSETIHHSTIDDCSAMTGGGIAESAGTMEVVTVKNCTATGDGGGALWNVEGTIDRCLFAANAATSTAATKGRGGALASCGGGITNSVIIGNQAAGNGGGISNTDDFIKNCTIVGNHSDELGGGLSGCGGSIRNCIITDNVDDQGGSNSNQVSTNSSTPNYCCLPGNWTGGGSNNRTTNTPGFTTFGGFGTDPFGWNLHLTSTSVCIDKGDNLTLIQHDFDGNGRPAGPASKWDIGAFERQ